MTNLDKDKQIATLSSGKTIQYDALISTMPLDITLTWLGKKQWADGLTHRYVFADISAVIMLHPTHSFSCDVLLLLNTFTSLQLLSYTRCSACFMLSCMLLTVCAELRASLW